MYGCGRALLHSTFQIITICITLVCCLHLQVVCSEVGTDCFNDICEFTWIHRTIGELPSQGIRFVSAIFLYEGVVHLLIIGLVKLYNSWSIERRIG